MGKGINICLILIILIISSINGCMFRDENEELTYFHQWTYILGIDNPNNLSFILYFPIPIWFNGTHVDVTRQKNSRIQGGNASIENTQYGYALNVSSNGRVEISCGEEKESKNEIVDHIILTMISNQNYSDLKQRKLPYMNLFYFWIYFDSIKYDDLCFDFYFIESWGKITGESREAEGRRCAIRDYMINNTGWQLVECYPWGV